MKAIKKIAAAASRLWGRLLKKRSFSALRSEGRRAAYRRLLIISLAVVFLALIILMPILSADSAQVELLALKQSVDRALPCHEACRQERLLKREKIAANLLTDKRLFAEVAGYFEVNRLEHNQVNRDFYQELLAIINLAYDNQEPPPFLINYLAESAGREEVQALIIRLVLARLAEPALADYYFMILEGEVGRVLKEESVRALNMFPDSGDFFKVEHIDRLIALILSPETIPALKPALTFLLTKYYVNFPEATILAAAKIYTESSETVIQLLIADLMASWGQEGYSYPEVDDSQWQTYFK